MYRAAALADLWSNLVGTGVIANWVGGVLTFLTVGFLGWLFTILTKRVVLPLARGLAEAHRGRMRAKYTVPCELPHVEATASIPPQAETTLRTPAEADDPLPVFSHPARFEVRGVQKDGERRTILANVGNGDAFGVIARTDAFGNCNVRDAASWDRIGAQNFKFIRITIDDYDLGYDMNITVTWTDASGNHHEEDAPLDDSAQRALNPFFA